MVWVSLWAMLEHLPLEMDHLVDVRNRPRYLDVRVEGDSEIQERFDMIWVPLWAVLEDLPQQVNGLVDVGNRPCFR
jgi:hypothetical protein